MRNRQNIKGFTLAELLIVVAIIGVLVAISIPIFTSQLEKSREATDAANIRSHYAVVMAESLSTGDSVNGSTLVGPVQLKQKEDGWMSGQIGENLESVYGDNIIGNGPAAGGTAWVEFDMDAGTPILHYEGGSSGGSTGGNTGGNTPAAEDPDDTPENDWYKVIGDLNSFTIRPGEVFSWNGAFYIGRETKTLNEWELENWNPDTLTGYWHLRKFSGKVWEADDFSNERSDVTEGDMCKVGDKYYIFIDGGHVSQGPVNQPGQWTEVHTNGWIPGGS